MVMNLVILAIVLASFALGFRIAGIRADVLDRLQRGKPAETIALPATRRRAMTVLPARRHAAPAPPTLARRAIASRTIASRTVARSAVSAASAPHS